MIVLTGNATVIFKKTKKEKKTGNNNILSTKYSATCANHTILNRQVIMQCTYITIQLDCMTRNVIIQDKD